MKLTIVTVTLLALAAAAPGARGGNGEPAIDRALQAALDESIQSSGAVGVSAAVVFADGRMWAGATGLSHPDAPLTPDMLLDIASVQKNLQAALALKLVEAEVLALDDPLQKWLPPLPHIDGAITIRQLLSLTSGIDGFVADPNSPFRIGYTNIEFEQQWTWAEIQAAFIGEPSFAPGTGCEYSTTNYILLKQVVEAATQKRQVDLLEDLILRPNRLEHTFADFSGPLPPDLATVHGWFDIDGDGPPEDLSDNSLNWISSLSPLLIYSTPSDLARWLDALYHRKTVLQEETLKEMLAFGGPVQGEPMMKGYGLGVADLDFGALLPQWEQVQVHGHLGLQYGYMTFAGYFPEYGASLVIMSNRGCDRAANQAMMTVGGAVIDTLLRHLAEEAAAG